MPEPATGWLRGAATDDLGYWDAAYICVLALGGLVVLTVTAEIALVAASWIAGKAYDPQPLGVAVAAICGGFSTAIGGLGWYMKGSQPRRPDRPDGGDQHRDG